MHFDALSLACICSELQQKLSPGRVQQVLLVSAHQIGLEIYAQGGRHNLLLSLDSDRNGVLILSEKIRRGSDEQPPLLLLLRKYVRDAILESVTQPDPYERVLRLQFRHLEHGSTTLVVEPMGRKSNLLLLSAEDRILDCLRRVPPSERSQRTLLPGQPYLLPPAQNKIPPMDDGSPDYYERLAHVTNSGEALWKALVTHVAGISPTLAREVAFRTTGNPNSAANDTALVGLVSTLQTLWEPVQTGVWHPGYWREGGAIVGFSAFEAHLPENAPQQVEVRREFVATSTLSEAIERAFATQKQQPVSDGYAAQRKQTAQQLEAARRRLERQMVALASDEPAPGDTEKARSEAEWLLAYSSQIKAGQTILSVDLGDEILEITLDPHKSAVEQAQQRFKRAGRMARASLFIPQRRAELQRDLDYLDQLAVDLDLATNQPEIAAIRGELESMGLLSKQKQRRALSKPVKTGQPLTVRAATGMAILVGRSARQNEEITFKLSHPRDLWLHVRNVPGSHVIIRSSGEAVDEATILLAAQLAAYHSKVRDEKSAEVIICERRFVQHAPGGRTGQVTMRNERVISSPATKPAELG